MPRRDFITSVFLIGLGLFVLIEAIRMPDMGDEIYAAPGVLPGLLGLIIAVCGFFLLLRSVRAGGWKLGMETVFSPERWMSTGPRFLVITLFLVIVYSAVLVGWIPFWLATFLFVLAFIAVFEWETGLTLKKRARHIGTAALQAIVVAAAVTYLFERLFLITLPG